MGNKGNESFSYTYSAKQQEEVRDIRKKYAMPEEDKMEQLRRLDQNVNSKATVAALIPGIIGALLLGSGMSLIMTELHEMLGLSIVISMIIGIGVGVVGIVLVCLAYPIYIRTLKNEREKAAPKILQLADELLQD